MITIRPGNESSTPPTEWMERLPENAKWLMILTTDEVLTIFKKIKINGEPQYVETVLDSNTLSSILGGLRNLT